MVQKSTSAWIFWFEKAVLREIRHETRPSTNLNAGGIQVSIPSNWVYSQDADGWTFLSADGSIYGCVIAYSLSDIGVASTGASAFDAEASALSVPEALAAQGATNIEVVGYQKAYSKSGKVATAVICITADVGGGTGVYYFAYIESKSYTNVLMICGEINSFNANLSAIAAVVDSTLFVQGEAIELL